ncbi:hypothetical protein WG922_07770 [Ramlibacter sp. AN1015]|uniref:hypothetical protein n=1 Tax=Ramlibacter sp. AN1015 TaxID=3133428 RepID=UPI0030BA79F2
MGMPGHGVAAHKRLANIVTPRPSSYETRFMIIEIVGAWLLAVVVVALFITADRWSNALWAKHREQIPPGGLLGQLWRQLTRSKHK